MPETGTLAMHLVVDLEQARELDPSTDVLDRSLLVREALDA
jgi:hypothetical protein